MEKIKLILKKFGLIFLLLAAMGVAVYVVKSHNEDKWANSHHYRFVVKDSRGNVYYTDKLDIEGVYVRFFESNGKHVLVCENWTIEDLYPTR